MTHKKNILDMPLEYFTDYSYVEKERKERPLIIKVLFQLLLFVLFMLAVLFTYRFINKIDFSSLYALWVTSPKVEHKVSTKSKIIKIKSVVNIEKTIPASKQEIEEIVHKVMVKMKVKKHINAIESERKSLDPAYIESIQKSLGKN
jgi:hypothetical protein